MYDAINPSHSHTYGKKYCARIVESTGEQSSEEGIYRNKKDRTRENRGKNHKQFEIDYVARGRQ